MITADRQTGVGVPANIQQAMKFYRQAAEGGDKRAAKRLAGGVSGGGAALNRQREMDSMKEGANGKDKDKDCVIM